MHPMAERISTNLLLSMLPGVGKHDAQVINDSLVKKIICSGRQLLH